MAKESPDIWMPLYIGDYLGKTMHLSTVEHGAYLLLLMAYWKNGGPIPSDDKKLAAICRVPLSEFPAIRSALEEYFEEENGLWRNTRADREIVRWAEMKEDKGFGAAIANFKRFGTPIPEKYAERYAERYGQRYAERDAGRTPSPSPSPSKELISTRDEVQGPNQFATVWNLCLELLGPVKTIQEEQKRRQGVEQLVAMNATENALRKRVKHYREVWPNVPCTLNAILSNWSTLPTIEAPKKVQKDPVFG